VYTDVLAPESEASFISSVDAFIFDEDRKRLRDPTWGFSSVRAAFLAAIASATV